MLVPHLLKIYFGLGLTLVSFWDCFFTTIKNKLIKLNVQLIRNLLRTDTETSPLSAEAVRAEIRKNPFFGKRVRNFDGENPRKFQKISETVTRRSVSQPVFSDEAVNWYKGILQNGKLCWSQVGIRNLSCLTKQFFSINNLINNFQHNVLRDEYYLDLPFLKKFVFNAVFLWKICLPSSLPPPPLPFSLGTFSPILINLFLRIQ